MQPFHFSPFHLEDGVLSLWVDRARIEDGVITYEGEVITPEQFYDLFMEYAEGRWFQKFFKAAYEERVEAIPHSLWEFAIFCRFYFTSYPTKIDAF